MTTGPPRPRPWAGPSSRGRADLPVTPVNRVGGSARPAGQGETWVGLRKTGDDETAEFVLGSFEVREA